MPRYVVGSLAEALDMRSGKALSRSRVLIIGLAYKKNVPDIRESPSLRLIEIIEERGAKADYHDPFVAEIPPTREHMALKGRKSVELTEVVVKSFDAVLVSTDHDDVDYAALVRWAPLIIDTRNIFSKLGLTGEHIVKS
jgi:UDP-N-acetyl-D-glucosamine dehydrogenase